MARVAGYDRAIYGLPEDACPLLFELSPGEPGLRALRHYPALMAPLLVQAFQLADEPDPPRFDESITEVRGRNDDF